MSFGETIFLFLLALVIFGPKKLPEIARQVGRVLNEVKRASNEFKSQIEQEVTNLEREETRKSLPPSAPPEGAVNRGTMTVLQAAPVPAGSDAVAEKQEPPASPELPSETQAPAIASQESHG